MVIANFDSDRIDHPGIPQKTAASVEAVREAMLQALVEAGFDIEALALPALRNAHITLKTNPIDNSEVLAVCWLSEEGEKMGQIQIRDRKQIYGELDIAQKHPREDLWFVESVFAWDDDGEIKTELRVIPVL